MSKTLFEKIWDKHVVDTLPDGTIQCISTVCIVMR